MPTGTNNPKYKETFNLKDEYINLIKNKFDENKCKMRINLSCETRYSIHDYVNNYKERTPNFIFKNIEEIRRKLKIEKDKIDANNAVIEFQIKTILNTITNIRKDLFIQIQYLCGRIRNKNLNKKKFLWDKACSITGLCIEYNEEYIKGDL